jgi:hypothetical protein
MSLAERSRILVYPDQSPHLTPQNPVRADIGPWGLAYQIGDIRYAMTGICEEGHEFSKFTPQEPGRILHQFMADDEVREFVNTITTAYKEGILPPQAALLVCRAQQRYCERMHNRPVDKAVAV